MQQPMQMQQPLQVIYPTQMVQLQLEQYQISKCREFTRQKLKKHLEAKSKKNKTEEEKIEV